MAKVVPLHDAHKELGASFGEFAGWRAPIDYGSVLEEHLAVRTSVGFFDLSHMGRLLVRGSDASSLLDYLVPRSISSEPGWMIGPTAFLNEDAGFKDDVMLYKFSDNEWMVVPNAINIEKDYNWISSNASSKRLSVNVEDKTLEWVLFAVQGPKAIEFMKLLGVPGSVLELKLLQFHRDVKLENVNTTAILISRSGWTGEDGFEIIASVSDGEKILRKASELIEKVGGKLCGLAARDSLRMEVGFVLYGHEINESINPVEARYWWVYQPGPKSECVGCRALRDAIRRGASKVRVGLRLGRKDRIVPRQGDEVYVEDVYVGYVTSGAYSPVLKRSIAQAYLKSNYALMGFTVWIVRRGKRYKAKVVDFPLVMPTSKPPT